MLKVFRQAIYLPILPFKLGECRALGTAFSGARHLVIPILVPPAAPVFDYDKGISVSADEHVKSFGARIFAARGQFPVFVDAVLLDKRGYNGFEVHPLSSLLERARQAGAIACPVTAIDRSAAYQAVVARFLRENRDLPVCIRASLSDIEGGTLQADLENLLKTLACGPQRCFLVLDFGPLEIPIVEEFVETLVRKFNEVPFLRDWLQTAVAMTSFPEKLAVKAGNHRLYERSDWSVYEGLTARSSQFLRLPIWGDYGVEYPSTTRIENARPSAHFRYTLERHYLIEKGTTTRKPHGFRAILPVGAALSVREQFMGAEFSLGDSFIEGLAREGAKTGNPSTWRWAGEDHHITLTLKSLCNLLEKPELLQASSIDAQQTALF